MKRLLLAGAVIALYLLHQDFWFWRSSRPLVFGFLPLGLFYHLVYTLAISALMWALVKLAWPSQLEERRGDGEIGRQGEEGQVDGETGRRGEEASASSPRRPVAPSPRRPITPFQTPEGRDQ